MCSSGGCGEPWRPGRDLALEDATGGAPDVVEDDVCGGGVVQHLQAGHHEDGGARGLGGDVPVELNLSQNLKLDQFSKLFLSLRRLDTT